MLIRGQVVSFCKFLSQILKMHRIVFRHEGNDLQSCREMMWKRGFSVKSIRLDVEKCCQLWFHLCGKAGGGVGGVAELITHRQWTAV